jgi:hypothetical protein
MENISSTADLNEAIKILEANRAEHLLQLREEFYFTMENLSPVNLIGSSIKEIVSSPNLVKNILGVAIGLFTGYLARKTMLLGLSNNKYGRIFSNVLQYGVASVVTRGPKLFKSLGQFIFQRLSRKRNQNFIKP